MQQILVTGGAGFIGSHMTDKLVSKKYQVVVFDNLLTGEKRFLNEKAIFVKGDVRDADSVEKLFKKYTFRAVFHIAGQASSINSFTDPDFDAYENYLGTINVVKSCLKHRVPRFLYASSMTVYGHPTKLPISENDLCRPISYYGISKYAAERFVMATGDRTDLPFRFQATAFRMFNVYGPRQSLTNPYQGVMAIFIGNVMRGETIKVFGDGEQSRDLINVSDVVEAWTGALDNAKSYGQVFNLGCSKRISVNELVSSIVTSFGKNPQTYPVQYLPARPGDQRHMQADMALAQKILHFHPSVSLRDGLQKTIAWAQEDR